MCSGGGGQGPDLQCAVSSDGLRRANEFLIVTKKQSDVPANCVTMGNVHPAQPSRSLISQLI